MSHKITIKPRQPRTNHPIEIKMQSVKKISSFFKNGFTFNPLTREQVEKWMPTLVNMDVNEKGFREAVEKYFIEISTDVPYAGKELEIGLDSNGEPINLEDYIKYLHCKGSRRVAPNKTLFDNDALYDFYLDDPKDMQKEREAAYASTLKANLVLAELDKHDEKAKFVLTVLSPGLPIHNMKSSDIKMELADIARATPERFVEAAESQSLEHLATINALNAAQIISKIGDAFIYQDITLGNNLNQVVAYIKNPVNSQVVLQMKAKLQQIQNATKNEYTEDADTPEATAKASSK